MGSQHNVTFEVISIIIGFFAAGISIFSFYPQFIKTKKEKNTKSLSLYAYIIFVISNYLWMIYGIMLLVIVLIRHFLFNIQFQGFKLGLDITLIIPYSFTTFFSTYILIVKIKNIKLGEIK